MIAKEFGYLTQNYGIIEIWHCGQTNTDWDRYLAITISRNADILIESIHKQISRPDAVKIDSVVQQYNPTLTLSSRAYI